MAFGLSAHSTRLKVGKYRNKIVWTPLLVVLMLFGAGKKAEVPEEKGMKFEHWRAVMGHVLLYGLVSALV